MWCRSDAMCRQQVADRASLHAGRLISHTRSCYHLAHLPYQDGHCGLCPGAVQPVQFVSFNSSPCPHIPTDLHDRNQCTWIFGSDSAACQPCTSRWRYCYRGCACPRNTCAAQSPPCGLTMRNVCEGFECAGRPDRLARASLTNGRRISSVVRLHEQSMNLRTPSTPEVNVTALGFSSHNSVLYGFPQDILHHSRVTQRSRVHASGPPSNATSYPAGHTTLTGSPSSSTYPFHHNHCLSAN